MSQPTMNDVAAAAGVSQVTVSMVLNGTHGGRVAPATADRVLGAARELGYRANVRAKVLREGRSRMIGLVGAEVATSEFAGQMILGAQQEAWRRGYVLLTVDTAGDSALERAAIQMMQSYRVAGVVYAAMYHRIVDVPEALRGARVVCVNGQEPSGLATSVFPDEEAGGRQAAQVLLEAGHRKIGMINIAEEGSALPAGPDRLKGFAEALAAAGVMLDPGNLRFGTGGYEDGLSLGASLLGQEDRPTAVCCANDRTALGMLHAASRLGLRVPEDLSLIGFDDQRLQAPMFEPRLTTFELRLFEMGRRAVAELLDGGRRVRQVPVACSLITRDSVA